MKLAASTLLALVAFAVVAFLSDLVAAIRRGEGPAVLAYAFCLLVCGVLAGVLFVSIGGVLPG